uniref:Separase n=1 Tax=Panagrolaimus sp. PS1159 TaxID=55785 RepID=A0AC35GIQ1_9BILA
MGTCHSTLSRHVITNVENKILKIIALLKSRQKEIQDIYDGKKEFNNYTLEDMNTYMKVADKLGHEWNNPLLKGLMEESKNIWLNQIFPTLRDNSSLWMYNTYKFSNLGKMLAGIAFLSGNYNLGLTYLVTALETEPSNHLVYAALLKWSCLLGEFDILHQYLQSPHIHESTDEGGGISDLRCVCRLFCEFYGPNRRKRDEINAILNHLINIDIRLSSVQVSSIHSFYAQHLIQHVLGIAALAPEADIETYKDYNYHMRAAAEVSLNLLESHLNDFMKRETRIPVYNVTNIVDSQNFLLDAMILTDYFVTEKIYCQALLESGCINDCESRVLCTFFVATKIVLPLRVLEPLNMLHYIKLRTANDHDKLKGIRAMTSLLLGRVFEDSQKTIVSPFRAKLLEENYVFPAQRIDQSFTVKSLISNTIPFATHQNNCNCFICYEKVNNSIFFVQKRYSMLLLENMSVSTCRNKIDEVKSFGSMLLQKEQDQLYKLLQKIKQSDHTVYTLPFLSDICVMLCNCLLINPDMPKDDKHFLCNSVITNAARYPCRLRTFSLLARHLKRKCVNLRKYPWLFYSDNKQCKRKMLDLEQCQISAEERSEFFDAESDFKLFGHIFSLDWRRRISLYLGAGYVESDPWQSAFYFIESSGTSLRQYPRIEKHSQVDLRFDNCRQFQQNILEMFPNDFTYIQLILDDSNVLWFIRYSADLDPVVIPLVQISNAPDNIPERFLDILVQNDASMKFSQTRYHEILEQNGISKEEESDPRVAEILQNDVSQKDGAKYWAIRESLEQKMENILSDIQNVWLQNFKCLFLPFIETDNKMERKVFEAQNILEVYGIRSGRAKFLAMLFFRADDEDDFLQMLWIFCYLERDVLNHMSGVTVPGNIYNTLMDKCFENRKLFNHDFEKDKYVVLSVSQELSSYPWECLPIFYQNSLVTRIQTLHFFLNLYIKHQHEIPISVDTKNSCLVIDPGDNMDFTLGRMKKNLNYDNFSNVFTSKLPTQDFLQFIKTSDIFVFVGHGHGNFNTFSLRTAQCRAVPILMGCSSVRIKDEGRGFDGDSIVHDFIISGAPAVIGCLWMVSDEDIDKFFIKFVELCASEWSKHMKKLSFHVKIQKHDYSLRYYPTRLMMKALVEARSACRLPLLTGASVVSYGLPVMANPAPLEAFLKGCCQINDLNNNKKINLF